MLKIRLLAILFLFANLFGGNVAAQKNNTVEVGSKISVNIEQKDCQDLKLGRAVKIPKPDYPAAAKTARVGGTVFVAVSIDEKGAASKVELISGHRLLQTAATKAAKSAKFAATTCDGAATAASAVLTYNFVPLAAAAESYFAPAKIAEFADLKSDSPYYEAVLNLTENHRLAFGAADKRFYADAPLVRGDFAHFLRLTLDSLSAKAAANNKIPREINLFYAHNPQNLLSVGVYKDLKPPAPFYDSVKTLLLKYDVALFDNAEFQPNRYLTDDEVIGWWTKIFGAEAIPVNFVKTDDADRIISRGEFALFLEESLQVLTYKTLP